MRRGGRSGRAAPLPRGSDDVGSEWQSGRCDCTFVEASAPGSGRDLGVWAELIGQAAAVATLQRAVAGEPHAMSHAWLLTGPPGSGRSNAGRASRPRCSAASEAARNCRECRTSLSGAHPDVTLVRTELLSIGVDEVRELVRRSAMSPTLGRWQVIVIEDADRITERGADALLKSIEEPARRTVWILCARPPTMWSRPSDHDVDC